MLFCTHNEIDLQPFIESVDEVDWVVVRCKECQSFLGDKIRLVSLIDEAVKRNKARKAKLDPDFEH